MDLSSELLEVCILDFVAPCMGCVDLSEKGFDFLGKYPGHTPQGVRGFEYTSIYEMLFSLLSHSAWSAWIQVHIIT